MIQRKKPVRTTQKAVHSPKKPASEHGAPDISFVVIGYNEAKTLRACLQSVRDADLDTFSHELIYVDGGSTDDSLAIANEVKVDLLLGGDRRRRAAENRNLGLAAARGRYIQFLDGDMVMAKDWPPAALYFLRMHDGYAAVCGNLNEANQSTLFRALQLEWAPREGPIRHCGGAAMYHREVLTALGGFPEDVVYGEEPYLCWRIRNELGRKIYQLNQTMADHDLGFRGWGDFWRRQVRCGATYAEIAARCRHTNDPLWLPETISNAAWAVAILFALLLLIIGPMPLRGAVLAAAALVIARKYLQTVNSGQPPDVAALYALQTYYAKIPIALGELQWYLNRNKPRGPA